MHCSMPWLGIIYMGCGVTNGGLIMEVIALQVKAGDTAGQRRRGCCMLGRAAHDKAHDLHTYPVAPSSTIRSVPHPTPNPATPFPLTLSPLTATLLPPLPCLRLQDVSSTEAAIIYTLEPVFGAGLAYVLLGERWGTSGWVGAGLIMLACLIAQLLGVEDEAHAAEREKQRERDRDASQRERDAKAAHLIGK